MIIADVIIIINYDNIASGGEGLLRAVLLIIFEP